MGDRREHARRGPCAQVSCLFVSAHHQTLLPVSLSLPRVLWPHVCFSLTDEGSASSLSVLLTAPLCSPHLGPWRTAPSTVLTSKPDVADWPYVLCLAHTGLTKKKEINASDKILRPQEFAPGCPACLKRLQAPASHLHSPLGSRCSHPLGPGTTSVSLPHPAC